LAHRFGFDPHSRLALVEFTGPVAFEEEIRALQEALARGYALPGMRVVVDRSAASLLSSPVQVAQIVDWMVEHLPPDPETRIAQVVPRDLDFGMLRMLELRSEGRLVQELGVFRTLAEACAWLGVEEARVEALRKPPETDAVG